MTNFKLIAAALVMSGGVPIPAQAAPISQSGIDTAAQDVSMVDQVLYKWAGHEFCFYDDGWRGPGWYWCGYRLRSGVGWGGPTGWHGWRTEGAVRERGRIGFEERGRVGSERRGSIDERGRIGVEERGRVRVERRGNAGLEQRGRIERGTTGRAGIEGNAGSRRGETGANIQGGAAPGGSRAGANMQGGAAPGASRGGATTTGSGRGER